MKVKRDGIQMLGRQSRDQQAMNEAENERLRWKGRNCPEIQPAGKNDSLAEAVLVPCTSCNKATQVLPLGNLRTLLEPVFY